MRHLALIIVLILLAFFLMGSSSSLVSPAQSPDRLAGEWKGSLTIAGVTLDFTITFSRDERSQLAGTIDIPAQGAAGIRLGGIKVEGPKISFIIDDPGAQGEPTFEGELDDAGKTIAGAFSQSGYEGAFSMDKVSGAPAGRAEI